MTKAKAKKIENTEKIDVAIVRVIDAYIDANVSYTMTNGNQTPNGWMAMAIANELKDEGFDPDTKMITTVAKLVVARLEAHVEELSKIYG